MPVLPTRPRILTSAREVTGPVTPEVQAAVSRVPVLGAPAAFLSATTPNTYTLRGPDNGRLRSFAFDRQQPNTIWALFDTTSGVIRSGRGYARSTDGGLHWTVPFRKEDDGFGVSNYIKVDPTDSNTIYADNWVTFDGGE